MAELLLTYMGFIQRRLAHHNEYHHIIFTIVSFSVDHEQINFAPLGNSEPAISNEIGMVLAMESFVWKIH